MVLDEEVFEETKESSIWDNSNLHSAITELVVKPEGKKSMNWDDFKKGYLR